jgi:hypothetical protein
MSEHSPRTFTSSRGVTVALKPMAGEIDRLNALLAQSQVSPPTFTVTTALGVEETNTHDPTTLVTDEDKAAWADYLKRRQEALREWSEISVKSYALNGIVFDDAVLADWAKKRAAIGSPIPDDPLQQNIEWVTSELLGIPTDFSELMIAVMKVSQVQEEMVGFAEAAFRRPLGQSDGADDGRVAGATGGTAQMVLQQEVRGNPDGNQVGNPGNKQVRRHARKR